MCVNGHFTRSNNQYIYMHLYIHVYMYIPYTHIVIDVLNLTRME